MTSASVTLYDTLIGAVTWDDEAELGIFEYAEDFLGSGIEISPITLPLGPGTFRFPGIARDTFKGLPGLLADCLPDKFGNLLIDQWLARQGRTPESFNPVERLCYIGSRAMGALEFQPTLNPDMPSRPLEIEALVELANEALASRTSMRTTLTKHHKPEALTDILRVGTSAGGARAKAIIAWNPQTAEVRSGQVPLPRGFEPWLIKFDGITGNRDKEELADPKGYGRIEFAYHLMAAEAGIAMSECNLLEENGRAHFTTRRFDRTLDGDKLHLQTLCGLAHYDFNQAGAYAYEQAFQVARRLGLPHPDLEELYRRAVFNIVTRNQDDHTKNISFLMNRRGVWALSPAYDVTYAYNPDGAWTSRHQMTFNGKRNGFTPEDLRAAAEAADVKPRRARDILGQIREATARWDVFAGDAGVGKRQAKQIGKMLRLQILEEKT